jgi:polysaccharide export outer membrane protein
MRQALSKFGRGVSGGLAIAHIISWGYPVVAAPLLVSQTIQSQTPYLLGAGDRLNVEFFNIPEYSAQYAVLSDGSLHLPQAGTIMVEGLTLEQATQRITDRYATILRRPIITLNLLEPRAVTVAIAGEISRPGAYSLSATEQNNPPTLTQMLQEAGGVTQSADIRRIEIQRVGDRHLGRESVVVDLWQLIQTGDLRQDIVLRDGDSIVIPTATVINPQEARRLANSNFASDETRPIQVAVVGEVNRPGPHSLRLNDNLTDSNDGLDALTVSQAIRVAGGITQKADVRDIQVRRVTHTGSEQVITVNFWELIAVGDLEQDLPLQDGDTIIVPTATAVLPNELTELAAASFAADEMTVYVVGEVDAPGAIALPPNTPLNQAILAAGGFNGRARRGSVELVRLNADGTVSQERLSVDLSEGLAAEDNPALQPGDTVVVGRSGLASISDTLGLVLSPVIGVVNVLRLLGI